MKKISITVLLICLLFSGCAKNSTEDEQQEKETTAQENITIVTEQSTPEISEKHPPSKEVVEETRKIVLEGMTQEEIDRLNGVIKRGNLILEGKFMFCNWGNLLSDSKAPTWNHFDQTGEIVVGYALEEEQEEPWKNSGMSFNEFGALYGSEVIYDNPYDADYGVAVFTDLKESVHNEDLMQDLDNIIMNFQKAKETHDIKYVEDLYHILHDMDYFLLRYGWEDVGKFVQDRSTLEIYYGALTCYN